jgi:hypothetical protein
MKKFIFAILIAVVLLQGCAANAPKDTTKDAPPAVAPSPDNQEQPAPTPTPAPKPAPGADVGPQGFLFEAYGQNIYVCAEATPIIADLPEPKDIFESPSCAFEGIDITYFYPGFELTTYPENGKDYVLSVVLTDDSVTTPEGIYLGGTLENVEKAYGAGSASSDGQLTYSHGKGSLIFTFEDDIIVGIVYTMIIEE